MIAALLLSLIPHSDLVTDNVDVIELNYVYDATAKRIFVQWIFWDWCEKERTYHVVAWAMRKPRDVIEPACDGWQLRYVDVNRVPREIRATSYRELHTQFDREIDDASLLPKERRKGLSCQKPPSR